jgi:hypothetical protein
MRPRIASGIVKGPRPLDLHSGFDGMYVKTDESRRLSYISRFAGRRQTGKARKLKKRSAAFLANRRFIFTRLPLNGRGV